MDKSWMMIKDRLKSKQYQQGVKSFIDFATKDLGPHDDIRCPCVDCMNGTKHSRQVVWQHLIRRGIACSYRTWVHHGEHVSLCHDRPSVSNDDSQRDGATNCDNDDNLGKLPIMLEEIYMSGLKSKKTNEWIHPKCGELHDEMVNKQAEATEKETSLTQEELSRQVLRAKKNYLRGFGVGPRPSSSYDSAARSLDKHMEAMRAEMEVLREERKRDREKMMTERQQLLKEVEEGKKAREAQQEQLNHLNDMVLQLTTMLQGSDGHRPNW